VAPLGVHIAGSIRAVNDTGTGNQTLNAAAITGVATVTGGSGNDTITAGAGADVLAGGAGNDTITGAAAADTVTGGSGNDIFVQGNATSVAATAASKTGATAIANGDTITFGNGVDITTDFVSGTDQIDLTTASVAPTTLIGVLGNAALTAGTTYGVLGTYTGGVFTVNTAATSATANVAYMVCDATATTWNAEAGYDILMGVTSLTAADIR